MVRATISTAPVSGSTSSSHTSQPLANANAGFSCIFAAASVVPSASGSLPAAAARASSKIPTDRSVPTTRNAPSPYSMSPGAASRRCAAMVRPAATTPSEASTEARHVVAGVVHGAGGRAIGEDPDHVGPPDRHAIAPGLARGALDQPLDGVDALDAADTSIDVDRHRVGEGAVDAKMDGRDRVEPGDHPLHV